MNAPAANINPREAVKRGLVTNVKPEQIQQVGIDLTTNRALQLGGRIDVVWDQGFNLVDCFGVLYLRSSYSRMGIILSSGLYDPGFKGIGGCTLHNLSLLDRFIEEHSPIAQIVLYRADQASNYNGYYNNSNSTESKLKTKHYNQLEAETAIRTKHPLFVIVQTFQGWFVYTDSTKSYCIGSGKTKQSALNNAKESILNAK